MTRRLSLLVVWCVLGLIAHLATIPTPALAALTTDPPAIAVGSYPSGMALSPDGSRLYAVNGNPFSSPRRGSVTVIDTATRQQVSAEIPLSPGYTERIVVSPDGHRIYVAGQYAVEVVDPTVGSVTSIYANGAWEGSGLAISPDGSRVYMTNRTTDDVAVIDTATNTTLQRVSFGTWNDFQPFGIGITPDGTRLYVASGPRRVVKVINLADMSLSDITISGVGPGQNGVYSPVVAMNLDGKRAYVPFESRIAVIDTDPTSPTYNHQLAVMGPFQTTPSGNGKITDLVVTPDASTLLGVAAGELLRVNIATGTLIETLPVAVASAVVYRGVPEAYAYVLTYAETPGKVVVVRDAGLTVTAGADQTKNEGEVVQLDGTASIGPNLSYTWRQLAGPAVVLSDPTSPTPTFAAPLLPGGFGSQTLTLELTVSNGGQSSSDTVDITVKNVNHAPVAEIGTVAPVNEGSLVVLDGTASYDPDGDLLAFQWVQTAGTPVVLIDRTTAKPTFTAPLLAGGVTGSVALSFAVTVSDGVLANTATTHVLIEQMDHAPVANAGPPQTVHSGKPVSLDGAASFDADDDPIGYQWSQVDGPLVALQNATTARPTFEAPPVAGVVPLTFRLTVSDGLLTSPPADVVITVKNSPPLCGLARPDVTDLWPPNHGLVPVRIVGVTDPDDATVALAITRITQDEPVNGTGDGDTSPDAVLQGDKALLRAERAGNGNGRVYGVHFTADDGMGGVCTGSIKVGVPHNKKAVPIDSGQLYDSTQP